jgi:hypothetical protein
MARFTKIETATLGPYSPKQFSDETVNALIEAGIQALPPGDDASSTSSINDVQVFEVLGNFYVLVTYTIS